MKIVEILRGPSCVGKSSYTEQYSMTDILSSDFLREFMLGDRSKQTKNKEVFEMLHKILDFRLANDVQLTVVDATNLKIRDVRPLIDICDRYHAYVKLVNFHPPSIDELIFRNKERFERTGFFVPEDVIKRHCETFHNAFSEFELLERTNDRFTIYHVYPEGFSCG
jgi:predicted kinase